MSDIYIVDDHALMRDGLRVVLEHGGHRVVGESDDITTACDTVGAKALITKASMASQAVKRR